jgi:hypothetical protein
MLHKKRVLLPEDIKALLAVDAPDNEAIARDLWVDTGWPLATLASANVGNLYVSEDETVELIVRPDPNRKPRGMPAWRTALLSPDVVESLLVRLEARRAATADPLLVDRGGRRYTRETFGEEILHVAEQARVAHLPEQILGGLDKHSVAFYENEKERRRLWRLPTRDALKERAVALLRSAGGESKQPRGARRAYTRAHSRGIARANAGTEQPAAWSPIETAYDIGDSCRDAYSGTRQSSERVAGNDQKRATVTITASVTASVSMAEFAKFVLSNVEEIDIQVRKSPEN